MSGIKTTDGSFFSISDHADMARLVFKRFGHDITEASAAWSRMMETETDESDFFFLVSYPEHTANCEGDCCNFQNERSEFDYSSCERITRRKSESDGR